MFEIQDKWAAQALDVKQFFDQYAGYGIINGGAASEGGQFSVDVSALTALVGGEYVGTPTQEVDVSGFVDPDHPRKGVIYVDTESGASGDLEFEVGEAEDPDPLVEDPFVMRNPSPPSFAGRDVTPVAGVYLPENAESIQAGHIRDRRVPANVNAAVATLREVDANKITDGADVTHAGELADLADVNDAVKTAGDLTVKNVGADYTASDEDFVVVDTSSGDVTVTLPPPPDTSEVYVKLADATNTTTVATPNSETIDGQSELTITSQWTVRGFISGGSNYYIHQL